MKRGRLQQLAAKVRKGTATEAEQRLLDTYYDAFETLPDREDPLADAEQAALGATIRDRIRVRLNRTRVVSVRRWLPYAAAAVLAIAISWLAIRYQQSAISSHDLVSAEEILPGGNRATLTLADGTTITLDEAQEGIIVGDEDITYNDGSELELSPLEGGSGGLRDGRGVNTLAEMLSLSTPKGGTYQITLPDGSRVWLNAASTLTYPSKFTGDERVVFLEGEAYFDIESMPLRSSGDRQGSYAGKEPLRPLRETSRPLRERIPFFVKTSTQTVEVLGTEFNISAYPDESETKTTLVEGSVRLSVTRDAPLNSRASDKPATGVPIILGMPGEQGQLVNGTISKTAVEIEPYTAWKDGYFSLDNKSLGQLMKEVARWYDVDVRYEGAVPDVRFYGDASRDKDLSVILHLLESAHVAYRLEGRTLIIDGKEGGKR